MTGSDTLTPQALIARACRITVKVGSSLLAEDAGVRRSWVETLAADVAELAKSKQVLIVSSGAVALGRARLGIDRSARLDLKQAAAAVGQPLLMRTWDSAFEKAGRTTAQLLLTVGDTEERRSWLNARATLEVLLQRGAVPIINENDSVATEELRYGDNDRLSARVAQMVGSDLLILLSDVDGFYTADPQRDPTAEHVAVLESIGADEEARAGGSASNFGTGGMRTKLDAARLAQAAGCATIIASGQPEHPLAALREGGKGTLVPARGSPGSAYKQWIGGSLAPSGTLVIDEGAASALLSGKSLLPSGVRRVAGTFSRGVCVRVETEAGEELARGISRYGSDEAIAVLGLRASQIAERLGYTRGDELIHRDDLVIL
jgi:glutamate 5-kinase